MKVVPGRELCYPPAPPETTFSEFLHVIRTFPMYYTRQFRRFSPLVLSLWLSGLILYAPSGALAQRTGAFPAESINAGIDPLTTEFGSRFLSVPMEQSVTVSVIDAKLPSDLAIPVAADPWQSPTCRPLAYVPDRAANLSAGTPETAIIPSEILSRDGTRAQSPVTDHNTVPVASRPVAAFVESEPEFVKEENQAGFKTEMEILESLWDIDVELGMQETSDFSNRVRFGTVARYKTPAQSLKVDMGFEQNQGDAEQVSNQLRLGTLASYRWKSKAVELDLKYERRRDEQENVTNRLLFDGTHEWFFNATRWSHYLGGKIEYDQLQDFERRFETNTGFAYSVLKNQSSHVKLKAGATVAREIGVEGGENGFAPDSAYGVSVNQNVTGAHKISTTVDYIPQWNDLRDYEVRSEAKLRVVLDEELDLQFQLGARNRYESSMPIESIEAGTEYTTSLMLKY